MKKLLSILALMLLSATAVLAANPTGFFVDKNVLVTGDWQWDGDSWNYGNFPTATFNSYVNSGLATNGLYSEEEQLGQPWKYSLFSTMETDAPTSILNVFDVWTVNDPMTTPATGGYTAYSFNSITSGQFSSSALSVNGYGNAFVGSSILVNSRAAQNLGVTVN